jgi:hypothetical protein
MSNSTTTGLVSISEEENPIQIKQQNRLKTMTDDTDDSNRNQSDSGISTNQQIPKTIHSLSKFMKYYYSTVTTFILFTRDCKRRHCLLFSFFFYIPKTYCY